MGKTKYQQQGGCLSGLAILIPAFLFAFLSHHDLEQTLRNESSVTASAKGNKGNDPINPYNNLANTGGSQVNQNALPDSIKSPETKSSTTLSDDIPPSGELTGTWPAFRGPGGIGIAPQKNIPVSWDGKSGKNVKWKTEIHLSGYNSPIIWNDKLFLTGASESKRAVYCLDVNSGKILWTKEVEKISGSPAQAPKVNRETGFSAPTVTTDGRQIGRAHV